MSPPSFLGGAAGDKVYGFGRPQPTIGALSNLAGYRTRDIKAEARKKALENRLNDGI